MTTSRTSLFSLPVRRPVATSMFFLGVALLGIIAWRELPVELLPPVEGDHLYVNFFRPGSEPEVVEREILLPLASRAAELPGVEETLGTIRGSGGRFEVAFEPGTDLKIRELELRRLAAELAREQPPGTVVDVQADDLSLASRFVAVLSLTGRDDLNVLRNLAEDKLQHRIAAVPGVSQVFVLGGAPREVTVRIDPDRSAAAGVDPAEVTGAVARAVGRLRYVGGVEDGPERLAVYLDGRPPGLVTLADTRIRAGEPVRLRHVADVDLASQRRQSMSRVDGRQSIAIIVFQEEGANLVRLGRALRERLDRLREEFAPYGIEFSMSFDGAALVEEQLDRLKTLGASGFGIALLVLFLFLRQLRAVAVVAVAVPVSLLAALALLLIAGQSLNLVTIFGLAVGVGMLVDNSIVVYEAVQRRLERGIEADAAAEGGARLTARAIVAASATTAVVFLPISFVDFEDAFLRTFLQILTAAILLPLAGSVVVAVGLVPLLARRLAAPAALERLARIRRRREALGGLHPPDRGRELFGALVVAALRRPGGWLTSSTAAVLVTAVIALPWVAFSSLSQEPPEADPVQLAVDLPGDASLERAAAVFDRLEASVGKLDGIDRVESFLQEANGTIQGTLSVYLDEKDRRPPDVNAARIRGLVRAAAEEIRAENPELEVRNPGEGGETTGGSGDDSLASLLGQGPSEIVFSGPDAAVLSRLATDLRDQLQKIPEVGWTGISGRRGQEEIHVAPDTARLASYGLTADQVLPALGVLRREGVVMQVGYTREDGREIPLSVRREPNRANAVRQLRELRFATPAGVLPLSAVAGVRRMPSPAPIQHHDGRRELRVFYRFGPSAPQTGPAREDLERRVEEAARDVRRPPGYTLETPAGDDPFDWFKTILVPVILLLFAVLAVAFESLTLPLLVLVALPMTVLGATWSLVFTGTPAGPMVLAGTLALVGLTVNPAILLVDRMQQRARDGASPGAAALAAVRERTRPVLMTTATTVAGLWPLALVTGRENEVWPPFATVVMGGLVTSTVLTLLVIPIGFVVLRRLDRLFGRLGPWVMIGWVGGVTLLMTPLIRGGLVSTMTWKIVTTVLVAALLLGGIVLLFRRPERAEPAAADGPPVLEVRYLKKVYGRPGPVARAWRLPERFARRVLARGGKPFDRSEARARLIPLAVVLAGVSYLALQVRTGFWRIVFLYAAVALATALLRQLRRARGAVDELGRALPGGPEGAAAGAVLWAATAYVVLVGHVVPRVAGGRPGFPLAIAILLPLVVLLVHAGRGTAQRLARGAIPERVERGRLRGPRGLWRSFARRVFGLDLPRDEMRALSHLHFRAEGGMVGILGPNGAGKTTLLRQLAGILDPTVGTITLGGVRLGRLRRTLARWVGYLPQDFGLPANLTAREYLDYYALLYDMKPAARRRERVESLLQEVGLGERGDERIGSYSGGMRQRVAVARTLLRLPPVIIVDEPTVGLDPRERIRFRNLLSRLAAGRVVLFSTHVVEDVAVACDRVIVLSGGRKVFDGAPPDLASHAEGRVWKARLGPDDESGLPAGARVVDQVPEADGSTRTRILCETRPHPAAEPERPSLEDGYLLLTGGAAS